jgi:hypothetical protein
MCRQRINHCDFELGLIMFVTERGNCVASGIKKRASGLDAEISRDSLPSSDTQRIE